MNANRLKAKIILRKMKVEEFLSKTGIERSHYYRVLRGEDEFDRAEILSIQSILELSDNEMLNIFFKEEVS